jgi:hypothetical protein
VTGHRGLERLGGPDAFEGRVDADALGEFQNDLGRSVAALDNNVRGPERPGQRLTGGVAAQGDDPLGAKTPGGEDAAQAHRAVSDDGDPAAGPNAGAHCRVVTRAHDIGEREQRTHRCLRVTGAGDADQGGVGEGHAHRFALASVDPVEAPEAAGDAGSRDAGAAVGAGAVAIRGRRDDQVTLGDTAHVGTRVLDHPDELVANRARLVRRLAAVNPEVPAADACEHNADDGIGGFGDNRVRAVSDFDHAGRFEDRRTHGPRAR